MTKHEARSFAGGLTWGAVEPFPVGNRLNPRATEKRADKFVVIAVLAFVVGFLSLFTFAASRNAPETLARDTSLTAMYGP